MNVRDYAATYISRGWYVVPLHTKSKICKDGDWHDRVYAAKEFEENDNIGIRLVAQNDPDRETKLVAVDYDATEITPEAIDALLPNTQASWGRESKLLSQSLYVSKFLKTVVFKDGISKGTIVEIRVDHQSMAPPSIHPDGEHLVWRDKEPISAAAIDTIVLRRGVQLLATYVMVARYYNPPGGRHEWGLALAGFFHQLNITLEEAIAIVELAGKWAHDREVRDRIVSIRTTYSKPDDDPVTGSKKLAAEIGDHGEVFVRTIRKIWGADEINVAASKIEQLNQRHAVLFQQSGQVMVMTEDDEDGRPFLRFSKPADMHLLYPQSVQVGTKPNGTPIYAPLGAAWLKHPKRRFYSGLELAPSSNGANHGNPGYYNMWRGYSVEPKQGKWDKFREHINLLADDNADYAEYIIAWMAETVQHPERPIGVSLAFRGGQGVGKSTFATWFGSLFGPHFLHLDSDQRLLGHFNAHLHNAILVLADEAVWAGGKQGLGALKRLVTEQTLAIERKGIDTIVVKNMIHMIIASNESWFVPTEFDDRRFAVFGVSRAKQNNTSFFKSVHDQLFKEDGLAALLYDLLKYERTINLHDIPETTARIEQKHFSMPVQHMWWFETLCDGDLWNKHSLMKVVRDSSGVNEEYGIDRDELYENYVRAMEKAKRFVDKGSKGSLGKFISLMIPDPYPKAFQQKSSGKRLWVVPALEICRKYYEHLHGKITWPEPPEITESQQMVDF